MKSQQKINGKNYNFEVWTMEPLEDVYRFGIQGWSLRKQPFSFSMRLPKQFIEEEISKEGDKEYLEKIAFMVANVHLNDFLTLNPGEIIANLETWFIEAKQREENK